MAATEPSIVTLKKARLFVAGGLAEDDDLDYRLVYWFAIHKHGKLATKSFKYFHPSYGVDDLQCSLRSSAETPDAIRVKDITHYQALVREHYKIEYATPAWREFIKRCLPMAYQEGAPNWWGGMGQWWSKEGGSTLVPMTAIAHDIAKPTGNPKEDSTTITRLLRRIREGIWYAEVTSFEQWTSGQIGIDVLEMLRKGTV